MEYKDETRTTYDHYAHEFKEKTKNYLTKYILEDADLFIKNLKGKLVIDLGSGPGRDSLFFKEGGLIPMCVDISESMIKLCKEKGLEAYVMDIENLTFPQNYFDGAWAYTSLLHLPKSNISNALKGIKRILKKEGLLYIGMKEGSFEGYQENPSYPGNRRFVSLYQDNELREILSKDFKILHHSRVIIEEAVYLNYLCTVLKENETSTTKK